MGYSEKEIEVIYLFVNFFYYKRFIAVFDFWMLAFRLSVIWIFQCTVVCNVRKIEMEKYFRDLSMFRKKRVGIMDSSKFFIHSFISSFRISFTIAYIENESKSNLPVLGKGCTATK